jgi:hypothetical protein
MPSTTIARGNSLTTFYIAPSITPAAVLTAITATQTFNIAGLQTTDIIKVFGYNGAQTLGIIIGEADCFNAGVLSIQFGNITGGTLTPAAGVYTIQIVRAEGPLPVTAV